MSSSTFLGDNLQRRLVAAAKPALGPAHIVASQKLTGKVVSTKASKTAVVAVETLLVHPVYLKRVKKFTKYPAHDEQEQCKVGDVVTLLPTKPLSKTKRFVVEEVLHTVAGQ